MWFRAQVSQIGEPLGSPGQISKDPFGTIPSSRVFRVWRSGFKALRLGSRVEGVGSRAERVESESQVRVWIIRGYILKAQVFPCYGYFAASMGVRGHGLSNCDVGPM